jgi:hypothetical protein
MTRIGWTNALARTGRRIGAMLAAAGAALTLALPAQASFVLMPDSVNNRMVVFSPVDGSVINTNLFGLAGGTPFHALEVGNEIWVSEQLGDRISRWGYDGSFLGQIGGQFAGGGLDNIRGMALIGDTVYVTNAGTNNNAPGAAIVSFSTSGAAMGSFSTAGLAPSPFGVLAFEGGMLVSSSSANDDIHRFTLGGSSLGTFHNTTGLNFAQQMTFATNGDILASGFSSSNVVRLDPSTGAIISSFSASGARGVFQLGNGNILWTNSAGAHIYDVGMGSSPLVYAGGGRYLQQVSQIPEPSTIALWAAGLALVGARLRASQRWREAARG